MNRLTDVLASNRGAGRTTAMLNAAHDAAERGHHVAVLGATVAHAENLRIEYGRMFNPTPEKMYKVSFLSITDKRATLGVKPTRVFRDHQAIESVIHDLAAEWDRWNDEAIARHLSDALAKATLT